MKCVAWFILTLIVITVPKLAMAIVEPKEQSTPTTVEINQINSQLHAGDNEAANLNYRNTDPGFQSFISRYGVNWDVYVDQGTMRPILIQGQGIPFVPGVGNTLTIADIQSSKFNEDGISIRMLESLARDFIQNNAQLFRVDQRSLRLNANRSGIFDNGNLSYVDFDYFYNGIPVDGAHLFFRINNGNLVQFGTEYVDTPAVSKTPKLTAQETLLILISQLSKTPSDVSEIVRKGNLIYLPEQAASGYQYRLVWEIVFRLNDDPATFLGSVDAQTGQILRLFDLNRYATVDGGILPRTATDAEVTMPLRDLLVVNGTNKCTDQNGNYSYSGGSSTSGLNGCYFNTNCTGCSNPAQPNAIGDSSGNIHFGKGGTDATGNGTSTKSDRNTFYHLNIGRTLAKQYLNLSWFNTNVASNVNINATCNAYWNGSVNFYRSGGGCNNTGEISDVIYHEWGHGLDANDGNPIDGTNGSMSEAVGDVMSYHVTHDRCIGPGFRPGGGGETTTCPTAVRDLGYGPVTASNVGSFCNPGSGGEYGYQVHCESHILSGAIYDLTNLLVAALGSSSGWARSEKLFFLTLPQAKHMKPTNSSPWYSAVLVVDDDNGNLADGTPNGCRIYQAFNSHGIASGAPVPCQSAPTQTPYPPGARSIPGLIEAEHFDNGGEGIAYHDSDPSNVGGQFRTTEAVDITTTSDAGGGYIVGWVVPGEWLEYTLNVATAGTYTLEARVASYGNGGTFHVEFNGLNKTGAIAIPNTGGWDTWTTLRKNVTLSAGNNQIMRVAMDTGGTSGYVGNFNKFRFAQYQGYLDAVDCQYILGWAWDKGQPNTPINVDIFSDGVLLATYPANAFRQDLLNAGIGNGYHAFAFPVPASLKNGQPHSISVKYSGTNDQLIGSPKTLTCGGASVSIVWIKPAEKSWGPSGSLTAAGYALNGTGTVQLVWRNVTTNGPWTVVAYQATPSPTDGSWSNSIPAPTNKCHVYQAYANYSGVTSSIFTYNGVTQGDCTIGVVSGTYGGNCGAPTGNATWHLAPSCNGKTSCSYTVSVNILGDPVPGCAKDYVAKWSCGGGSTIKTATALPEAGWGSIVNLTCP